MKRRSMKGRLIKTSLAALSMMAVTGITSYAVTGWVDEGGTWYYYEDDDEYAYDEWKRSGDHYFYLGSDGAMLTDTLIDDGSNYYYVNETGAMVTDQWVLIDDETAGTETDSGYVWYYFGSNGRAYKKSSSSTSISKRTIGGKTYAFDEEGHMLYGWVDADGNILEDTDDPFVSAEYYFGDWNDGSMHEGWLEYEAGTDASSNVSTVDYEDYDKLWFYFGTNGKKYYADSSEDVVTKTIGGVKYAFDQNGVMLSDWIETDSSTSSDASGSVVETSNIKYFSDSYDGHLRTKSWIYAIPSEEIDQEDYNDSTYRWFYSGSNGSIYKDDIKTINGKKYAFDENGIMQAEFVIMNDETGFVAQYDASDLSSSDFIDGDIAQILSEDEDNHLYYFSGDEENDGSMKTGKSINIELDDGTYTFGFKTSGKAYGETEIEESSNKYYQNGLLLKASSDYKYGVIRIPDAADQDDGYKYVVVTTSGAEVTGTRKYVKDSDGNYIIIMDSEYYGYLDGADHAPVWDSEAGLYCEYDDGEDGNLGDPVSNDTDGSELTDDMRLNF